MDILSISCEIAIRWKPQDPTDDLSTSVQVMAYSSTVMQQAIIWTKVDQILWQHDIMPLGHNELNIVNYTVVLVRVTGASTAYICIWRHTLFFNYIEHKSFWSII